jgi:hypothetical protein
LVLEQVKEQMGHFRQSLSLCLVHYKQDLPMKAFCYLQEPYRSTFALQVKRVLGYFLAQPTHGLFGELVQYFFLVANSNQYHHLLLYYQLAHHHLQEQGCSLLAPLCSDH